MIKTKNIYPQYYFILDGTFAAGVSWNESRSMRHQFESEKAYFLTISRPCGSAAVILDPPVNPKTTVERRCDFTLFQILCANGGEKQNSEIISNTKSVKVG